MAKLKLTKSAVDAAQPQAQAIELRDTLVPGFLCKVSRGAASTPSLSIWPPEIARFSRPPPAFSCLCFPSLA